ncbi:MAG TPA: response regulator transcription factor [Burkholderiaceae bacterium]|nr:response regulator transcription factor [Burkholderiaceae bacterium]
MTMSETPYILVADDQAMMRDGIVLMLKDAWPDCICKSAHDYLSVVNLLENQNPEETFSLVILDLRMPGMRGVESVAHITKLADNAPVVVCTALEDPSLVSRLMHCGIFKAVSKASGADELLIQVRDALASSMKSKLSTKDSHEPAPTNKYDDNGSAGLTNRQREILKFLQTGKPNKVIATQLGISLGTTKCHLHNLYAVMQVQNRAEAIIKSRDWLL